MYLGIDLHSTYVESSEQRNGIPGDDNDDDHVGQIKAILNNQGWLGEAGGGGWWCWFCFL